MTYATAADVEAIAGRTLDTAETALVERRLEQVERMIVRRIPYVADKIDAEEIDLADVVDIEAEEIDLADVVDIEAEAVLRLVRNPEGYTSESDGTYSYQFNRETASGRLEILPSEWETLGVRSSGMFSIAPRLIAPAGPVPFNRGG